MTSFKMFSVKVLQKPVPKAFGGPQSKTSQWDKHLQQIVELPFTCLNNVFALRVSINKNEPMT